MPEMTRSSEQIQSLEKEHILGKRKSLEKEQTSKKERLSEMTQSSVEKIEKFNRFGSILGLERMEELLKELGNPEKDLNVIHVAGTNGKGSVCVFIDEILQAEGYSTGRFISPYLESFNERISYNGKEISDEDLDKQTEKVLSAVKLITDKGHDSPTEFEVVTAIAFLYFAEKQPDYVILEVGLGGRGDSTNVVEKPLITVITSIDYDHTDRLGSTLSEIAGEKAGIIKTGVPVISNVKQKEASDIIRDTAADRGSEFVDITEIHAENIRLSDNKTKFDLKIGCKSNRSSSNYENGNLGSCFGSDDASVYKYISQDGVINPKCVSQDAISDPKHISQDAAINSKDSSQNETSDTRQGSKDNGIFKWTGADDIVLSMLGFHQCENAKTALATIMKMKADAHVSVSESSMRAGLEKAVHKGRMEVVCRKPLVILDGAHNSAGATALAETLGVIAKGRKIILVTGILQDKNVTEMSEIFSEFADEIIVTQINNDRTMTAEALADYFDVNDKPLITETDARKAVSEALKIVDKDGTVVIAGSLYLIGQIRQEVYDGIEKKEKGSVIL